MLVVDDVVWDRISTSLGETLTGRGFWEVVDGRKQSLSILQASSSLLGSSNCFASSKRFEVLQCNIPGQAFDLCHHSHQFENNLRRHDTGVEGLWDTT